MTETPTLVPLIEAAPRINRRPNTLRRDMQNGTVPGIKIGSRWYMSSTVLDRILAGEDPSRVRVER